MARWDISTHVLKNLEWLKLDYLIAIGGDDTLSYAATLDQLGVKVIAIPKTMDNDVRNTEYCIGFSTAITRAMDAIQRQRTTVGSHERVGIFRVFGRDAGYHGAVHGLRHLHPLLHSGVRGEPGQADRPADGGKAQHRQQLRPGGAFGRREVGRLHGAGVRRAGCLRASQEGQHRRSAQHRDQQPDRRREHRQRSDLRSAQRRAGLRRQADRRELRQSSPWTRCSPARAE